MYSRLLSIRVAQTLFAFVLGSHAFAGSLQSGDSGAGRIEEVASKLNSVETPQQAIPLVTELARLGGFSIWTDDRQPVAKSVGTPLHLAVTESEIKNYSTMFLRGQSVRLGDLASALDVFYDTGKTGKSCAQGLVGFLNEASTSKKPAARSLGLTFSSLKRHDRMGGDSGPFDLDTRLNPVQTLFIVRIVSEELIFAVRKTEKAFAQEPFLYASIGTPIPNPFAFQDAPGWAEDGFVGGLTGLIGEGIDKLGNTWENVGKAGKAAGYANTVLSLVKFISTYVYLKGEGSIEAPGNPLVRTQDTTAGSQRTVKMKFFIDGTAVQDWVKENRKSLATFGIDFDMPKTGALAGLETEWELGQSRKYASKQLVQLVRGSSDISKIKTDANGVASISLEGKPQPKKLNPKAVRPVMKNVPIRVTPQTKGTEMNQDITDAVLSAIGIKSGPAGLITPIMECLYRMKWSGSQTMVLGVKDWEEGDIVGDVTFLFEGSASQSNSSNSTSTWVRRMFDWQGIRLDAFGAPLANLGDPAALKGIPPELRKQMEKMLEEAKKQSPNIQVRAIGPGDFRWFVDDGSRLSGDIGECVRDVVDQLTTVTGSGFKSYPAGMTDPRTMPFFIEIDLKAQTLSLDSIQIFDVIRKVTTKRKGKAPSVEQFNNSMKMDDGLEFDSKYRGKGIVFPMVVKETATETVYRVEQTIPFKFDGGGTGKLIANINIRWVKKATK